MAVNGNGHSNGNGHTNGNGHSNGKIGDIAFADGFHPSDRMLRFRNLAFEAATTNGLLRVAQWRARTVDDPRFEGAPVTKMEWAAWMKVDGFSPWFHGHLNTEPPTAEEFALMDNAFWDGLAAGLAAKQEWAFKAYAKVRIEAEADEKKKPASNLDELKEWLARGGGGGWRRQPEA